MLTINDITGKALLQMEIGKGSKRVYTLMKEDYVSLKFSLPSAMHFALGTWCELPDFGRFELAEPYQPKQNAKTGGWDYELTLEATYMKWRNKIFRYYPETGAGEASWSLTATLATHMAVFLRNLNELGYRYGGNDYDFAIDDTVADESRLITYEAENLLDALYAMADTFETEVWVADGVIFFGKCEFGDAVDFAQDVNVETMSAEGNRATYATRLYAFGSDRNLPKSYRPTEQSILVSGVVQKRLMLPEGTPYIDAREGMATDEAVEAVVVFDDVYPRTQSEISDITATEHKEQDENGEETDETWTSYRFRIPSLPFKAEYILEDTDLTATFETGRLAGMTFNVAFNPDAEDENEPESQVWEIVRNEDYGRPLPDTTLCPQAGDKVVLAGWDATKIASLGLVAAAEQELRRRAEERIETLKIDPANYRCKMISATMFDAGGVMHLYTLGSRVNLINAGCFAEGSRQSRIIGYEYDLARPFDSPVYVVGEKVSVSRTTELEDKVEALTLKGQTYTGSGGSGIYLIRTNDSTPASDTNAYSALRVKRDFLSRVLDDVAVGKISFAAGLRLLGGNMQFGESFVSGATGVGGRITTDANAELESLALRSWLEVPEIRYNRATVLLGDQWQAPGGGIIESVTPDGEGLTTGTITLKLEEGEIGAVAVDDICKGYFHDFGTPANNATADHDDSRGNTTFSGFCTVFFRVTEIVSTDGTNKVFRYSLRPTSDRWQWQFHPYEAMHFVGYGNFTDSSRQRSAYQTRTYTRFLMGVNDWEFTSSNIAMQMGDMTNLSVFSLDLAGYSAYLDNVYVRGHLQEVKTPPPIEMTVTTSSGDNFISEGETLSVSCAVKRGTEVLDALTWSVSRDSGDTAADAAWNAEHTDFSGAMDFTASDIGATSLNANSLFTFSATGTDDDGKAWSAHRSVTLRTLKTATALTMRFISEYGEYDTFISFGDTVQFRAVIEDALRNDYTSLYTGWRIERHNGDTPADLASDGVWNATRASISSAGVFSIEWSAEHDDLQAERATFVVTADRGSYADTITGLLSI